MAIHAQQNKEKIRLVCIDATELRGERANPIIAKAAKDYLNNLVADSTVTILRITEDRYGRTIAELSIEPINIQEHLVKKGMHASMKSMHISVSGAIIKYEKTD